MRLSFSIKTKTVIMAVLIVTSFFTIVQKASLNTNNTNNKHTFTHNETKYVSQNLLIKQRNPVVNEGNQITLTAIDSNGAIAKGIIWSSGSPDIVEVNPNTGEVSGIKQGFATITASQNGESISTFVVVTRVKKGKGEKIPGDSKVDGDGKLYLSNPSQNVILLANKNLNAPIQIFAGQRNLGGNQNGFREQARFAGPTAITINNSPRGGIYVTDTLNHQIRKVSFTGQVETVLGTGLPGKAFFDSDKTLSLDKVIFNSPRGVVADAGGNIYIADTDNHAIYYVDFATSKATLLAGEPGVSGQEDGFGNIAKFKRPSAMALSSDGKLLTVADEDNNRVRLIDISRQGEKLIANVSTLGVSSGRNTLQNKTSASFIAFDKPHSVSLDGLNNIYVVDNSGVKLVSRLSNGQIEITDLAQPGASFNKATNVVVKGTEVFVLDEKATSEDEAIGVVTVGSPEIKTVTPSIFRMETGADVVVTGSNFAPETQVIFGDSVIKPQVISATELRFQIPSQNAPGIRTVSILTRGGLAQRELNIIAKPASELAIGEITTIAGGFSSTGDGGSGLESSLSFSRSTIIDKLGNIFIGEITGQKIRRIDGQTNIINTIAGGGQSLEDGILANVAKIEPMAITMDSSGNIFFCDFLTESIRRIDATTNIITTIAGGKGRPFSGDGNLASNAGFGNQPVDLLFDNNGNLFVIANNRVRRIDAKTGIINTIVGNGQTGFNGDGKAANTATLDHPSQLAFDSKGNLFIADTFNDRVRRVDAQTNIITTVVGGGSLPGPGTIDGKPATSVMYPTPFGLAVDSQDNLVLSGLLISKVDMTTGIINNIKQVSASTKCGDIDLFDFFFPIGSNLTLDGNGNLFACDNSSSSSRIRKLNLNTGVSSTIAGQQFPTTQGENGLATNASLGFNFYNAMTVNSQGDIFIADSAASVIRRIDAKTGIIKRFAGVGKNKCNENVNAPNGDGGQALNASFSNFQALATDDKGNLYIADSLQARVRRVDAQTNVITTFAGDGVLTEEPSGDGGLATKASLGEVNSIAIDLQGNLIITTDANVRKVDAKTNIITTIAGNGSNNIGKDGDLATKVGVFPARITVDSKNNILIAERMRRVNSKLEGARIRRIDAATGTITTIAGNGNILYSSDGSPATNFGFGLISNLAVDSMGNIFFSAGEFDINSPFDPFVNFKLFKIDANTKTINTFIRVNETYQGDGGTVSNASLVASPGLSFTPNGDLLLLDTQDFVISALRLIHLPKGSNGSSTTTISISNAVYTKPSLFIDGQGFSSSSKVTVNGTDTSAFISSNANNKLVLTSSRKKLNIRKGVNQLTVTNSDGATSSFQFTF